MTEHMSTVVRVPIELDNPSVERIESLCVKCGLCAKVCRDYVGVLGRYDLEKTGNRGICTHCGQCIHACPVGSLVEKDEVPCLKEALKNPEKIVIVTTSPAVRVALGESFGLEPGTFVQGKMVSLLRKLGAKYVLDTNFGADLTIIEEASEFVERVKNHKEKLPQWTSCCPAWVKYCELFYPEVLPHLSTAKSPIAMQGATMKTYFAKRMGIDPSRIVNVALTPCTAKKFEINRPELNASARFWDKPEMRDTDFVITTRELARWAKEEKIDFESLEDSDFDHPLGYATGAGVIFAATGGVMLAALRSAYFYLTGENLDPDSLHLEPVDGDENLREATVTIGETSVKVAVVFGTATAGKLIEAMKEGKAHYDFVEVMTCPGGCIGGGGQPRLDFGREESSRNKRIKSIFTRDKSMTLRRSHENPEINELYKEFYGTPLSKIAHEMLHTTYKDRSSDLDCGATKKEPCECTEKKECSEKKECTEKKECSEKKECAKPKRKFRCKLCGYVYEGESLPEDYVCPLCQAKSTCFMDVTDE